GDHDRAIQNYDEALALNSNLSLVRYQLAQSWLHKQEYDKAWRAVQCYRQAGGIPEPAFIEKLRQASGRQEDDHYNHGLTRMWCQGDLDGAIDDFPQTLEHNPRDASAYMNRGTARSASGDQDGAIADTTKALELNPRDADAYYNRGLARGNKGDRDDAIKDLQKAADLYQQQGETSIYQKVLNTIKQLQGIGPRIAVDSTRPSAVARSSKETSSSRVAPFSCAVITSIPRRRTPAVMAAFTCTSIYSRSISPAAALAQLQVWDAVYDGGVRALPVHSSLSGLPPARPDDRHSTLQRRGLGPGSAPDTARQCA